MKQDLLFNSTITLFIILSYTLNLYPPLFLISNQTIILLWRYFGSQHTHIRLHRALHTPCNRNICCCNDSSGNYIELPCYWLCASWKSKHPYFGKMCNGKFRHKACLAWNIDSNLSNNRFWYTYTRFFLSLTMPDDEFALSVLLKAAHSVFASVQTLVSEKGVVQVELWTELGC